MSRRSANKRPPTAGDGSGGRRRRNDSSEEQFAEITDELMCPICQELLVKAVLLNCSHTFCEVCIEEWKESNPNKECPICRAKIKNPNRALVLDDMVDRVVDRMSAEQRREREKLVDDHRKKMTELQSSRAANSNRGQRENAEESDSDSDESSLFGDQDLVVFNENQHNSASYASFYFDTMNGNIFRNCTFNIWDSSDDESDSDE